MYTCTCEQKAQTQPFQVLHGGYVKAMHLRFHPEWTLPTRSVAVLVAILCVCVCVCVCLYGRLGDAPQMISHRVDLANS
jgi:hypothetical protein